jgi:uncharacterized protein involved in exopolysaccharide biosynthesis
MANNKTRKSNKPEHEQNMKAFNPTKSKVGRVIILILALGMFLGMVIAAVYGMINVLS